MPLPLSPDQRTSLSAAIPLLLFAQSWNERLAIIEQHEEALRSEEALGILAVIRSTYSNDRRFQERVDTVRMTIDEAREDGYVGVPRPLTAYFEGFGSRPYFESGEVVALLEEAAKANPGRNDVRLCI